MDLALAEDGRRVASGCPKANGLARAGVGGHLAARRLVQRLTGVLNMVLLLTTDRADSVVGVDGARAPRGATL